MNNLTARLKGSSIEIFDVKTGGIQRVHNLPPASYSNLTVAGENVTITINYDYKSDIVRTINMRTGAIVSEFSV